MSIRARLVVMCVVVSLLPAIPLSILVQSLIEKSFDLGLSTTVEDALQSGLGISQSHLSALHAQFEESVTGAISHVDTTTAALSPRGIDGVVRAVFSSGIGGVAGTVPPGESERPRDDMGRRMGERADTATGTGTVGEPSLPEPLVPFLAFSPLSDLPQAVTVIERAESPRRRSDLTFYVTNDRSIQLAFWQEGGVLFYKRTDPEFLRQAGRLIEGRQIFAQLRLAKPTLSRSFFYPFVVIYAVILVLALAVALLMAERLSDPIRRLASGANTVAAGDWGYRLDVKSGGEIGRLVEAFNEMVSRLDAQRRRLVDMERMATWREMARHLAHEIKNPLLPIRLTIQELRDQYNGEDPKYRETVNESVRVIGDELDHLQKLVKEFSSFARMPELVPRVESLDSLVRDVAKLYTQTPIAIEVDPKLKPFAFDSDQMRRVIVNLLDNARSALEGTEHAEIRIGLRQNGDDAVIEIADNGHGIPEENLARVFDPYFSTRKEGSGLGLAIVKNIVLLHGGAIEARSGGGALGGATFVIRLPTGGPPGGSK